ncbi:unnamed protein product [Vitrella brassicaformis CCMP3155]|uniref:Magnesium transporter n=2 Tax=Vitrella brassicaformis TaxID=1169539 RepID=A0A0G4EI29_VITBC|nr:unnamed protein product [Vitrella brassicaformis CCMP3155]|eukprot:CEL95897.1 unnamed protein product [Vitrella brassicaformis CCMP3155]
MWEPPSSTERLPLLSRQAIEHTAREATLMFSDTRTSKTTSQLQQQQQRTGHIHESTTQRSASAASTSTASGRTKVRFVPPQLARKSSMAQRMARRTLRHTVLEIKHGGLTEKELTTAELLRIVHQHNKYHVVEDKAPGALKYRDIRQILSDVSGTQPSFEVRRNCLLINLPPIRAIILHDTVLIIPQIADNFPLELSLDPSVLEFDFDSLLYEATDVFPESGDDAKKVAPEPSSSLRFRGSSYGRGKVSLLPLVNDHVSTQEEQDDQREREKEQAEADLKKKSTKFSDCVENILQMSKHKWGQGDRIIPFEFAVLEAVLVEVCSDLHSDFKPLKTAVEYTCNELGQDGFASTRTVEGVNRLKSCLTSLQYRVKGIQRAIAQLLDNDEDMSRLEISRFYERPSERPVPARQSSILIETPSADITRRFSQQPVLHAAHRKGHDHRAATVPPIFAEAFHGSAHSQADSPHFGTGHVGAAEEQLTNAGTADSPMDHQSEEGRNAAAPVSPENHFEHEEAGDEPYSTEDVELLLECYMQEVELLDHNISLLDETLDDVLQLMNLHLATVRNKVLKLDLGLNAVGVVVGFGACVGGLFGMNLRSGLEDSFTAFYAVFVFCMVSCILTAIAVGFFFKRALTL